MKIESRAYGTIDIDQRQIITFPRGIFGFESKRKFALLDAKQSPFYWLQSLEDVQTAFVLISPDAFRSDFRLSLASGELELIKIFEDDLGNLMLEGNESKIAEVLVFAIVTVNNDKNLMTANLQGPIIINAQNHLGMQGIQTDDKWKTKHYILEEIRSEEEQAVLSH